MSGVSLVVGGFVVMIIGFGCTPHWYAMAVAPLGALMANIGAIIIGLSAREKSS